MNRDLGVWTSEHCALMLIAGLDTGVTLIDTGDFYGRGHNELLIARALKGRDRDSLLLSAKFGALRDPTVGSGPYDGRPAAVKSFLDTPLTRLSPPTSSASRPRSRPKKRLARAMPSFWWASSTAYGAPS